ncbi:MAG TPA: amidase family protein, partial [Kineosporiaceae bacterium]|nr:amidase family protein [Kineosporiaceae bacterium]
METTAVDLAAAVRSGRHSARDSVEQALDRIAKRDRELLAFRVVRAERAVAEAEAVDVNPDRASLPLAGVPIAIKDNVAVTGEFTGNGSAGSSRSAQPADHQVVARLRAAGAVVVGLTNVPELCVFATTDSTVGITRNPWDGERSPGGSSGGSAAAVAAGMVPVAHGNDGLGSIRIPAACNGLVGIKPGLGTVPADLGNGSWFDMSENGPLSTTVADAALLLSVMANRPELADVAFEGRPNLRVGISVKAPMVGLGVDRDFVAATRGVADL